MKKHLLFLAVLSGVSLGLAPALRAQTTDTTRTVKPQLNTAPPGAAPAPRQPAPVYQPTPAYPATPDPNVPASRQPYDPTRPSGMDLPQRPGVAASTLR